MAKNSWQEHLSKTRAKNPKMSLKQAMVAASKTYKRTAKAKPAKKGGKKKR